MMQSGTIIRIFESVYTLRITELAPRDHKDRQLFVIGRHNLKFSMCALWQTSFQRPIGAHIGHNTVFGRDDLLDGRHGLHIWKNVSKGHTI
ncbi:MAG: hypothetical protein ACXV29_11435 [Halobacteriota archaeon]